MSELRGGCYTPTDEDVVRIGEQVAWRVQRLGDQRLERCPYGEAKPTCLRCPIHCYRPAQRERIRRVMRFSGPRMVTRHPLLTALHLLDGQRDRIWPPVWPPR